jgi:hypothetical protein
MSKIRVEAQVEMTYDPEVEAMNAIKTQVTPVLDALNTAFSVALGEAQSAGAEGTAAYTTVHELYKEWYDWYNRWNAAIPN